MKKWSPSLLLLLATVAHAQAGSMAAAIRQGRAALVANQPERARSLFAAALAHPDGDRADTTAAALGLGQADLWLGHYAEAATAFRTARAQAVDDSARQAVETGLAQILNAQDYPAQAYALVAPFASGQPRATLELLRAAQSLGWQDKAPPYLQAVTPPIEGYLGTQYPLLADDMQLALAPQVQGSFGYSHDSDKLSTYQVGAQVLSAPIVQEGLVQRWGVAAGSNWIDDPQTSRRMDDLALLGQLRIADSHYLDLDLGLARSGNWQTLQGDASWTWRASDSFGLTADAARAPILTDTALAQRIASDTYSLGASLRPGAQWYLLPTYYHQDFSDGNQRDGGSLRLVFSPWDIPDTAGALGAELSSRAYRSTQPSTGTYFNPAHYSATQLGLIGVYSLDPRWKLRATVEGGRQTIDGSGAGIYTVDLSLEGRLPHNGRLQLHLVRSSAASDNSGGSGYWNDSLMLSLSYPL